MLESLFQGMLMQFTEQQQEKLNKVQLDESWKISLSEFLLSQKMDHLREFLQQQILAQKTIYPPSKQIFNALNTTPLQDVKVVILGQDPYLPAVHYSFLHLQAINQWIVPIRATHRAYWKPSQTGSPAGTRSMVLR